MNSFCGFANPMESGREWGRPSTLDHSPGASGTGKRLHSMNQTSPTSEVERDEPRGFDPCGSRFGKWAPVIPPDLTQLATRAPSPVPSHPNQPRYTVSVPTTVIAPAAPAPAALRCRGREPVIAPCRCRPWCRRCEASHNRRPWVVRRPGRRGRMGGRM